MIGRRLRPLPVYHAAPPPVTTNRVAASSEQHDAGSSDPEAVPGAQVSAGHAAAFAAADQIRLPRVSDLPYGRVASVCPLYLTNGTEGTVLGGFGLEGLGVIAEALGMLVAGRPTARQ